MRRPLPVLIILLTLMACGAAGSGGVVGPATDDPVGAVNRLLHVVQEKRFGDLGTAVCAEKREAIARQFDPSTGILATVPGVDVAALLAATTVTFTDLRVEEVSRTGDGAVVAVDGTMTVDLDDDRVRALVAPLIDQQGLPATTLDMLLASIDGASFPIAGRGAVVHEDGVWRVCDVFV